MKRLLDKTIGRWIRHLFFVLVRTYYGLFYNIGMSGKHLLQQQPGSLILATHVSRHDGPMISALLYSTARIRPTVHYSEYHHPVQKFPMYVAGAIPMSSPTKWAPERRKEHTLNTFKIIGKVLRNGNSVLLFPAGKVRRQPEEIVGPRLKGVREVLRAHPDTPVMLLRTRGLGKFQEKNYDLFWSFLGRKKGRRHVQVELLPVTDLDPNMELTAFNAKLEDMLNG